MAKQKAARTPRRTKAQQAREADEAAQPSTARRGSQPAKAQSEIGPTTYREGEAPIQHGATDPETQDAYAMGHPSQSTLKRTPQQRASVAGPGVGEPAPAEDER